MKHIFSKLKTIIAFYKYWFHIYAKERVTRLQTISEINLVSVTNTTN